MNPYDGRPPVNRSKLRTGNSNFDSKRALGCCQISLGATIRILAVPGTQQFAFKLRPSQNKRGTRCRTPLSNSRFPKTKRPTYCQSRLVLRRRGLLALATRSAPSGSATLHLREGWIRGEERSRG